MIQNAGGSSSGTPQDNANRTWGTFPLNTADWSIFLYFKYPATPAAGRYISLLNLFAGATNFTAPYVFLGSDAATSNAFVEVTNDAITFHDTTKQSIVNTAQNWAGITYDHTTHVLTFYVNNASVGTATCDLHSVVWNSLFILGDTAAGAKDAASVAYLRCWQSKLTQVQLNTESGSAAPVITTNLIFNNPFQTSIDLTDHVLSNTNNLSGDGIFTDPTDPHLTVVSGPPTNTSPGAATALTTDFSVIQDTLTSGTATTVWYKYDIQPADKVLSLGILGDLSIYFPAGIVYASLADALANSPFFGNLFTSSQFPTDALSSTIYFKILPINPSASTGTLQISLLRGVALTPQNGNIIHAEDNTGVTTPAIDATNGQPLDFLLDFSEVSDNVAKTTNGNICIFDFNDYQVKIYDMTYTIVAIVPVPHHFPNGYIIGTDGSTSYWVISRGSGINHSFAYQVSLAGAIIAGPIDMGPDSIALTSVTPNIAGTKLYWARTTQRGFPNLPISQIDLGTLVTSDFISASEGTFWENIQILANDHLVVGQFTVDATPNHRFTSSTLRIYDNTATKIREWDLFPSLVGLSIPFLSLDNPSHFYAWCNAIGSAATPVPEPGTNLNYYYFFDPTSSSIPTPTLVPHFEEYVSSVNQANTFSRYGTPVSGAPWVHGVESTPPGNVRSGLYFLSGTGGTDVIRVDRLWIDAGAGTTEDVGIPNPFAESYLFGDE